MSTLETNELHYGDNLQVMREKIPDEIADLIYLDPPFNSARNYNLLFKQVKGDSSPAQIMAFEDTWQWSPRLYEEFKDDQRNQRLFTLINALYDILGPSEMMAYVLMMAPRLLELHRKLKPTGCLYLHCDPTASHYLKIILDVVFGPALFKNEVIWKRTSAHNSAKRYGPVHDSLLFYTRCSEYKWNQQYTEYDESYTDQFYRHTDNDSRRFRLSDITGSGTRNGPSGKPWRGIDVEKRGRHWMHLPEELERLDAQGRIYWPPQGEMPAYKRYLDEMPGIGLQDIITDIQPVQTHAKERRGYPTQKPLALLERIIAASSNEGDVVFDPFCGCGTAIVAAERMNRKWIGIDVTYLAIAEVVYRLETEGRTDRPLNYKLVGTPTDALGAQKLFEQTAPQNHKPFEQFCVSLVRGEYREQRGADRGIDGIIHLWDVQGKLRKALVQVKGGNALSIINVREFARVIEREDAVLGLMISQKEATKEMRLEAERMGYADWPSQKKYPRYQIRTVKDLLEDPKNPFEIPDSYRVERSEGVGKKQDSGQTVLEVE